MTEPGMRVLFQAPGPWVEATVTAGYADGTWCITPDEPELKFMPHWHGVVDREIAVEDRAAWGPLHARFGPDGFSSRSLAEVFAAAGLRLAPEAVAGFWDGALKELFDLDARAVLTEEQSYRLLRRAGLAAASLVHGTAHPYLRLWWNQTRMGGRDPAELARPITLADALGALGLADAPDDPAAVAAIAAFEASSGIAVPSPLAAVFRREGATDAILRAHPNNPEPVPVADWIPDRADDGTVRIVVMLPHQGAFRWVAAWTSGADDARIEVSWDTEDGAGHALTADRSAFFFWDLAQTGACWFDRVGEAAKQRLERTDVGFRRTAVAPA